MSARMSAIVKVFGCRPDDEGATYSGAGVRKPPREETAGKDRRWFVTRYGDLMAADDAVREGKMIQRAGRGHCGSCARGCPRRPVKILAHFEWTLGQLLKRCGSRRRTSDASERICGFVALS